MKITKVLVADYANVTREGKLNVLGIFTTINALSFPVIHPQMQLIYMWECNPSEAGRKKKIEIELRDADGKRNFLLEGEFEVPTAHLARTVQGNEIVVLNNLSFEKPGSYVFNILVNGDPKEEVTFELSRVPLPKKG